MIESMNLAQVGVAKVRAGPLWSLLSRTAVVWGRLATSTQAPPLLSLRLDLRQVMRGAHIQPLVSSAIRWVRLRDSTGLRAAAVSWSRARVYARAAYGARRGVVGVGEGLQVDDRHSAVC